MINKLMHDYLTCLSFQLSDLPNYASPFLYSY